MIRAWLDMIARTAVVGWIVVLATGAAAQHVVMFSSPKGIYYEPPATTKTKTQPIAVRFWIELHARSEASSRTVAADHVFHNNDRTRFRVATSADCYVYVAHRGASGERALLFPSVHAGRNNHVRRHQAKTMPSTRGYFTFDEQPGREHVVIVVSPQRIAALEKIAAARVGKQPARRSMLLTAEENRTWSELQKKWTGKPIGASTAKLASETDKSGRQVGSYYAGPEPFTRPVLIDIALKHEK